MSAAAAAAAAAGANAADWRSRSPSAATTEASPMEASAARAFASLDIDCHGAVGAAALQRQHEQLHGVPIAREHAEAAIRAVCGSDALTVSRHDFLAVLEEMQKRYAMEMAAHWDFSLLSTDEGTISLEQAFYLFKAMLASGFVTSAFNAFLAERLATASPGTVLRWQEIQQLLWQLPDVHINPPACYMVGMSDNDDYDDDDSDGGSDDSDRDDGGGDDRVKDEKNGGGSSNDCAHTGSDNNGGRGGRGSIAGGGGGAGRRGEGGGLPAAARPQAEELGRQLAQLTAERCAAAAAATKRKLTDREDESGDEAAKEREEHIDAMRAGARTKLLRWEDEGLSSILNDSSGAKSSLLYLMKTRSNPDLVEVSRVHERKYDALRKLLLKSLARTQQGDFMWEILTEQEQEQACGRLAVAEKQLRRQLDPAAAMLSSLSGASLPFITADGYTSLNDILGLLVVNEPVIDVPSTVRRHLDTGSGDSRLVAAGAGAAGGIRSTFAAVLSELNDRERAELWLVTSSWTAARRIGDVAAGLTAYCRLMWQVLTIESYSSFEAAALAAGIRERAPSALTDSRIRRLDRSRYESLSLRVISSSSDDILFGISSAMARQVASAPRELSGLIGKIELFDAILSAFQLKHVGEREELLRIVQRPVFANTRTTPLPKTRLEKASLLSVLRGRRSRWRESTPVQRSLEEHDAILQEAVAIYFNETKKNMAAEGKESSERGTLIRIMADLLEEQELEFARVLDDLLDKDISELKEIYATQEQARCGGFFDNIAALTIGDVALINAEQLVSDQLQRKYDCLRLRLIEYSLLAEFGVGWLGRSEADRQQLMSQRDAAYRKHVQDGALAAAEQLLGDAAFDFTVHQLLGENRADFAIRLAAAADQTNSEKEPQQINIEAALQNRFFAERTALLDGLHIEAVDSRLLLKRLALEVFLVMEAADYLSAAYGVGLLERLLPAGRKRHQEDKERMVKLSKVHIDNYQQRYRMGIKYVKMPVDVQALPNEDDGAAWLELTVKVAMKKHVDEQEVLLRTLTDSSLQDLCAVIAAMSREEQQRRLVELQNKQRWLVVNSEAAHHENVNILEESAAIRWVMLKNAAVKRDEMLTDSELFAQIMVSLVELQHDELAAYLTSSSIKSASDLAAAYRDQTTARKWNLCKNVCVALTTYDGPCPGVALEELLREKYRCLTRKYVETFYGERTLGWLELKPEQRADRIGKFCADVEQLRSAGKFAELAGLYRDYCMEPVEFVSIFGDNQFEFLRKLLDSLKQSSGGGGARWDALTTAAGLKEEVRPVDSDLLAELERRRVEEWQCLSHLLQGVHGVFWGDSGRLAEAIRLRHQVTMCALLETVTEAGHYCMLADRIQMIVHLAPNDPQWRRHLLARDWSRLTELGHELLLTLDERVSSAKKFKPSIVEAPPGSDRKTLLEAVFQLQQQRQSQEARTLHAILTSVTKEQTAIAAKLSRSGRYLKLAVLQQTASSLLPSDIAKRNDCLKAAAILKLSTPTDQADAEGSATEERMDVTVASILAELIEMQMYENALLLKAFNEQDDDEVMATQAQLVSQLRTGAVPTALKVMLRSGRLPRQKEHELADAVHSKYDAAQDRLLLHVIASKSGDRWKGMTELQRHNALGELRDSIKQLVVQGQTAALRELVDSCTGSFDGLVPAGSSVMQCLQDWCREEIQTRLQVLLATRTTADTGTEVAAAATELVEAESRDDALWNKELDLLRRERRRVGLEPGAEACVALLRFLSLSDGSPEVEHVRTVLATERARALLDGVRTVTDWTDDSAVATSAADSEGDSSALLDELIDVVERRHKDERETMVKVVIENEDRFGSAVPETELKLKLADLAELRLRLLNSLQLSSAAHAAILKEAVAHQCALRMQRLQGRDTGMPAADKAAALQLHATFLAELSLLQEKERTSVLAGMASKVPHALARMLTLYKVALQRQWNDNVAAVLLPPGGQTETMDDSCKAEAGAAARRLAGELVAAVEGKYEAARDRLLMECMRLQRSDADWQALTETDRQRLVMEFHHKVEALKAQGKNEEASAALHDLLCYTDRDVERNGKMSTIVRQQLAAEKGIPEQEIVDSDVQAHVKTQMLGDGNRRAEIYAVLESRQTSEKARMLEVAADADAPLLLIWLRLEQSRVIMAASSKQWDEKSSSAAAADAALALAPGQELSDVMTSYAAGDKESQLELARQRFDELLRAAKADGSGGGKEAQVPPLLRHARWLVATLARGKDAREILQEALVEAVQRKHQTERKLFVSLTQHVTDNHEMLRQAEYLGLPKMLKALEKLETDVNAWRASNKDVLGSGQPLASSSREEQLTMLQKAALYRTMVEVYQHDSVPTDDITNDLLQSIFVALLSDIQSCQASEEQSINELLLGESTDVLEELVGVYTSAQIIPWVDNLAAGLLLVLDDPDKWVTETRRLRVEDNKYQAEKQRLLDQMIMHGLKKFDIGGEEVDAMEYLKTMELEQAAQKQAGVAEVQKQRNAVATRRSARIQEQQQQNASKQQPRLEYGVVLAMQLVTSRVDAAAGSADGDSKEQDRDKWLAKMKEKMAERQFARSKISLSERLGSAARSRSASPSSQGRSGRSSQPSGSRENAEEVLGKMVRDHSKVKEKLTAEEKKQQELIKKKRDNMKAQKESEVINLLTLGERQKTTLEKSRQEDRSRQDTMVGERISRIRQEKTLTAKGASSPGKKFTDMVESTADGADRDQKMAALAKELEQKLKAQEFSLHHKDEKADDLDQFPQALNDEERMRIIKEKRAQKRLKRRESFTQQ